jgi:hypothetical protein
LEANATTSKILNSTMTTMMNLVVSFQKKEKTESKGTLRPANVLFKNKNWENKGMEHTKQIRENQNLPLS